MGTTFNVRDSVRVVASVHRCYGQVGRVIQTSSLGSCLVKLNSRRDPLWFYAVFLEAVTVLDRLAEIE